MNGTLLDLIVVISISNLLIFLAKPQLSQILYPISSRQLCALTLEHKIKNLLLTNRANPLVLTTDGDKITVTEVKTTGNSKTIIEDQRVASGSLVSSSEVIVYPSGAVTPQTLICRDRKGSCRVTISLRGRTRRECTREDAGYILLEFILTLQLTAIYLIIFYNSISTSAKISKKAQIVQKIDYVAEFKCLNKFATYALTCQNNRVVINAY
jgi:hypothetical protein